MKGALLLLVLAGLGGCRDKGMGIIAFEGELPPGTEIAKMGARCAKPLYCGETGYLDCGSAVDGPAYYFSRSSGRVVSVCGGACMGDRDGRCARECPPAAWTCRPAYR